MMILTIGKRQQRQSFVFAAVLLMILHSFKSFLVYLSIRPRDRAVIFGGKFACSEGGKSVLQEFWPF